MVPLSTYTQLAGSISHRCCCFPWCPLGACYKNPRYPDTQFRNHGHTNYGIDIIRIPSLLMGDWDPERCKAEIWTHVVWTQAMLAPPLPDTLQVCLVITSSLQSACSATLPTPHKHTCTQTPSFLGFKPFPNIGVAGHWIWLSKNSASFSSPKFYLLTTVSWHSSLLLQTLSTH
jgi:hypothetical protein